MYKKEILEPIIKQYETTLVDLKQENKEMAPEINFSIEDIGTYVQAKKNLEKWNSKTLEAQQTLEEMIQTTDSASIGELEIKLSEFRKCLELTQSNRGKSLRSHAEVLKQIDIAHVKVVLELKKVLGIINEINAF